MKKKIGIAVLILLAGIQFIRPARNTGQAAGPQELSAVYPVPQDAYAILQHSCYDCHSNHTDYPWYTNIQPLGWWLQHHVNEGKEELNFSEFGTFTKKRKLHKLEEVAEQIEHQEMPLSSYTLMHKNAKLSPEQAALLVSWAKQLRLQIEAEPNNN